MPDPRPPATDDHAIAAGLDQTTGAHAILRRGAAAGRVTHVERMPARPGLPVPWPAWVPEDLTAAFARLGIAQPWEHQAAAADLAWSGQSVILATGTASGKSVGYLAPALTAVGDGGTALYLSPTRALAADQFSLVRALGGWPGRGFGQRLRPAVVDSDTPASERAWARKHATYLLTTPDMLHFGLLPQHQRWSGFFRRLRYVVVDECHGYRGVFGSHVAHVLRRLRRVADHHHEPGTPGLVFVLASATISEPARAAELLTGLIAHEVTNDAAPRGALTFAMWEPPFTALRGEAGAPLRRTAVAETAGMLADLVRDDVSSIAFIRSRRGVEAAAASAKSRLTEAGDGELAHRVAAYRSGYLPQERRELEEALRTGAVTALAATPALELGINTTGLDAVLIAGWPGSRSALWQQAGRAGRDGKEAVAILIARNDPLDTYLVHHPEALLHRPVEATVLDPANPYILGPHLCAAAAEMPPRT
jgi:DEAD/DEAH box helicase domain-containing protein